MEKITGMDWLKKHIQQLEVRNSQFKKEIDEIIKIQPEVYNEFNEWTPLKLVLLNYALDVCTTIINKYFDNKYYVDLFAGSGINRMKNKGDFLIGSPLIAALKYRNKFTKLFFCENNLSLFDALKERVDYFKEQKLLTSPKNCNDCLDDIIKEINSNNSYSFFFIDPHCMEFNWESMKKVLNLRSDIVFTLMSGQIIRTVQLAKKYKECAGEGLNTLFGDDSWKSIEDVDDLVRVYSENIIKEKEDCIVNNIKIQSKKFNFVYHILFITHKTKNDSPWLKALEKAKKEIEFNSDKSVEMALELITKRQRTLF